MVLVGPDESAPSMGDLRNLTEEQVIKKTLEVHLNSTRDAVDGPSRLLPASVSGTSDISASGVSTRETVPAAARETQCIEQRISRDTYSE